jgi:hypothetical protein
MVVERGDAGERIELVELPALLKDARGHKVAVLGENPCRKPDLNR